MNRGVALGASIALVLLGLVIPFSAWVYYGHRQAEPAKSPAKIAPAKGPSEAKVESDGAKKARTAIETALLDSEKDAASLRTELGATKERLAKAQDEAEITRQTIAKLRAELAKGPVARIPVGNPKATRANYLRLDNFKTLQETEMILGPGKEVSRFRGNMDMVWVGDRVVIRVTFQFVDSGFSPTILAKSITD